MAEQSRPRQYALRFDSFSSRIVAELGQLVDFTWHMNERVVANAEYPFPRMLNYSVLALTGGLTESSLFEICRHLESKKKHPISVKDFGGSGVERSLNYLQKTFKLRRAKLLNVKAVEQVQLLRNAIVHANGYLDLSKDADRLRNIRKEPFVWGNYGHKMPANLIGSMILIDKSEGRERLVIQRDFVMVSAAACREFVTSVLREVKLVRKVPFDASKYYGLGTK